MRSNHCRLVIVVFLGRLFGWSTRVVYSGRLLGSLAGRAGWLFNLSGGVASEGLTGYNSAAWSDHRGPLV